MQVRNYPERFRDVCLYLADETGQNSSNGVNYSNSLFLSLYFFSKLT